MITSHIMPLLARRIDTAPQQQGPRSSGNEQEDFAFILEDFTAEAEPVEDEAHQDGEDDDPTPKAEGETLPEIRLPSNTLLPAPQEGSAQGPFLRPASMALSVTGMIFLDPQEPSHSGDEEPADRGEVQADPFRNSAPTEELQLPLLKDTRQAIIQSMEGEAEKPNGLAAMPPLPDPEDPPPKADAAFAAAKAQDPEVPLHPSPAIQIMAVITAEAPQAGHQPETPAASQPPHLNRPALPSPSDVKALRIKLQPEELGEVEVTIRRVGLQTKVTITVAGKAAADAVSKDKGLLEDRLNSLFNPGTASAVSFNMEVRDASTNQGQGALASGGQGFTGAALPDGRNASGQDRSDRQHQPLMRAGDERENENRDMLFVSGSDRVV